MLRITLMLIICWVWDQYQSFFVMIGHKNECHLDIIIEIHLLFIFLFVQSQRQSTCDSELSNKSVTSGATDLK